MPSPCASYPGPAATVPVPFALVPGSASDPGLGPAGHPHPPCSPCLSGRAGGVTWPTPALAASGGLSHLGQGAGPAEPRPRGGMVPPATACHVAQHVTDSPALLPGAEPGRGRGRGRAGSRWGWARAGLGLGLARNQVQRGTATGLRPHSKSGIVLGKYWWVGGVLQDLEGPLPRHGCPLQGLLLNLS